MSYRVRARIRRWLDMYYRIALEREHGIPVVWEGILYMRLTEAE